MLIFSLKKCGEGKGCRPSLLFVMSILDSFSLINRNHWYKCVKPMCIYFIADTFHKQFMEFQSLKSRPPLSFSSAGVWVGTTAIPIHSGSNSHLSRLLMLEAWQGISFLPFLKKHTIGCSMDHVCYVPLYTQQWTCLCLRLLGLQYLMYTKYLGYCPKELVSLIWLWA